MSTLHFKWTISRARDSYGYNIVTLKVNDIKKSACNGGGYDMMGTVLGNYIARTFKDELVKKTKEEFYGLTFHDPNYDPGKHKLKNGKTVEQAEEDGESLGLDRYQAFYSASSKLPTKNHVIPSMDGACGMGCMETIMREVLKLKLVFVKESKNDSYYTLETTE